MSVLLEKDLNMDGLLEKSLKSIGNHSNTFKSNFTIIVRNNLVNGDQIQAKIASPLLAYLSLSFTR